MGGGVRWRSFGQHVSWFTGRIWWKQWGTAIRRPVWVSVPKIAENDGRWHVVKIGFFGIGLFIDRHGHYLPDEPNRLRRWVTGRIS